MPTATPTRNPGFAPLFLVLAGACATPATPEEPPGQRAEYRVRLLDPSARALQVELHLTGLDPRADGLELALPDSYSFVSVDAPLLAEPLRARAGDGSALNLESTSPYRWTLTTAGATEATVTWTSALTAHDRPEVAERDSFGHPYVAADHALLMTGAALVAPTFPDEIATTWRVRFEAPIGWPILCPWREVAPGVFDPESRPALQDDLVAFGAWSTRSIDLAGMQIDIGIAPGQPALDALAVPAIEQICAAELALFDIVPRPRYLFLFVAPKPVRGFSFSGSPKHGAMVLQVCGDLADPIAVEMIAGLVAHEFHHLWGVARLDFGGDLRFVGEGFTDWYAHMVPARLGIVSWERTGEQLGTKLDAWNALAPKLDGSLVSAGGPKFFEAGVHYEATYTGGLLVAALLDLELRRAGRADGLDGWMRELVNDPRWKPRESGPSVDDFLALVESTLGSETRERVARWIEIPGGFDPDAEFARLGVAIDRRTTPRHVRANFDGTRIVNIDSRSEAGRIGLREGDTLLVVNDRAVDDANAIQSAWSEPIDGQVRLRIERAGEPIELNAPAEPAEVHSNLDANVWRETSSTQD